MNVKKSQNPYKKSDISFYFKKKSFTISQIVLYLRWRTKYQKNMLQNKQGHWSWRGLCLLYLLLLHLFSLPVLSTAFFAFSDYTASKAYSNEALHSSSDDAILGFTARLKSINPKQSSGSSSSKLPQSLLPRLRGLSFMHQANSWVKEGIKGAILNP